MERIELVNRCLVCQLVYSCSASGVKTLCDNCPNAGTDCLPRGGCSILSGVCPSCNDNFTKKKEKKLKEMV